MEEELTQAVLDLVHEAMREKNSKTGYKRTLKAFDAIGLNEKGRARVLYAMGYTDRDGQPWDWLSKSKAR